MRNPRINNQRARVLSKIRNKDPKLAESLANLKLDWFKLKNEATDTADLYIYDEIVPAYMVEWFGGVSAEGLIEQLSEITASTINVRINSPGGAVFEAVAIYNTLVSHSASVNVFVDALAASAASIVAMAGDHVTMMVGSQMMIHDALGVEYGNAADMRAMADFLDKQSDNIASIYANKAGGDISDWRDLMLKETWLFATEAVDLGLADEVYSADTPPDETKPEEGSPEEEQQESPEEEQQEQEAGQGDEGDTEQDMTNLMRQRHPLTNRGFQYSGRNKAPKPPIEDLTERELDDILDRWSIFGRK